jgi:gliding motility-associated-like protein
VAQSFQNNSLESWGTSGTCLVNSVPDNWVSFTNEGFNFDECDFAFCGSTIPAEAADGNIYGRAYSASSTSGEGIAQEVVGFLPGNEYQLTFQFAGSNLLPGFNPSRWHIFMDNVNVDQSIEFSSTEAQWSTHSFSFIATSTSHVFGFRACSANTGGGSAAIDNFLIQNLTPIEPIFPIASFTQSDQVFCAGECILFSNTSQFEADVSWTFEAGNPSTSTSNSTVEVCYTQTGVYEVELVATNNDGTDTLTVLQSVTVLPFPAGSILHSGDSLLLITETEAEDFDWNFNGTPLLEDGYIISPVESGLYEVNLVNEALCSTSLNLLVEDLEQANEPEPISIWIPNAMIGSYDAINNIWGVFGEFSELESFETQVFNRWGEMVFQAKDPTIRWTGNAFGGSHYVPSGVYIYKVTITFRGDAERRQYHGHINLIR